MRWIRTAALVAAGVLAGCENRVDECNKLIRVINTEGANVKPATDENLKEVADALDALAKKMEAVQVSIPELKKYRDQYRDSVADMGKKAHAAADAKAEANADPQKITDAKTAYNAAVEQNNKLTADINGFCGGKP